MNTPDRLQIYLAEYGRRYPAAWRQYDSFRAGRGKELPNWPAWCWCPLAAAYSIISGDGDNRVPIEQATEIGILGALAAWRMTQGIYRYDSDLFAALWSTPLDGDLPIDVLYHLPEWCVYIEVPPGEYAWLNKPLAGWFVHLEWDAGTGRPELRFVLDFGVELFPNVLHLTRPTLEACAREAVEESIIQAQRHGIAIPQARPCPSLAESIAPLVSVALYLCTVAADIVDAKGRREKPTNPAPVKTKRGPRIFPASGPTNWLVGYRVGASLRLAQRETSGRDAGGRHASPRPHIRRAHWHSYWTGPRAGARKVILKWLPPTTVGAGELVPTIHEVE